MDAVMDGLDDIIIPTIMIDDGWSVDDLKTIDDCDDAFAFLTTAVAEIEFSIEMNGLKPTEEQRPEWAARDMRALKYKKAGLQIVGMRRGRIERQMRKAAQHEHDRLLLAHIKSVAPVGAFNEWIRGSGVMELQAAA